MDSPEPEIVTLVPIDEALDQNAQIELGLVEPETNRRYKLQVVAALVRLGMTGTSEEPIYSLIVPDPMERVGTKLIVSKFDERFKIVPRTEPQIRMDRAMSRMGSIVSAIFTPIVVDS